MLMQVSCRMVASRSISSRRSRPVVHLLSMPNPERDRKSWSWKSPLKVPQRLLRARYGLNNGRRRVVLARRDDASHGSCAPRALRLDGRSVDDEDVGNLDDAGLGSAHRHRCRDTRITTVTSAKRTISTSSWPRRPFRRGSHRVQTRRAPKWHRQLCAPSPPSHRGRPYRVRKCGTA